MHWSKLRTLFLGRLAPELASRVDVHAAAYKSGGRTWVTFDGVEIACVQAPGFTRQVLGHSTCADLQDGQTLELGDAIFQIIHRSIDESLESPNPLIRAVALLDGRCGKRRIERMAESEQVLPSMQAVMVAARLVALRRPPVQVICDQCGATLAHEWNGKRRS